MKGLMSRAIAVQVKFENMFLQELQLSFASHPGFSNSTSAQLSSASHPGFSNSTSAQASFHVGPISSCIIKLKFGNVGLSGGRANLRSTHGKTKITHSTHLYGTGPKSNPATVYIGMRQALSALC